MTPLQVVIFVGIFSCVDAVVLYAVFSFAASILKDLAAKYPMNEHAIGPWREFQSIAIDSMNFGYCVHIYADSDYVHIAPTRLMRAMKGQPMSIPKSEMRDIRRAAFGSAKVKLNKQTLTLPRWAVMES